MKINFEKVLENHFLVSKEWLEKATWASSRAKIIGRLGKAFGARDAREARERGYEVARSLGWDGRNVMDLRLMLEDLLQRYDKAGA